MLCLIVRQACIFVLQLNLKGCFRQPCLKESTTAEPPNKKGFLLLCTESFMGCWEGSMEGKKSRLAFPSFMYKKGNTFPAHNKSQVSVPAKHVKITRRPGSVAGRRRPLHNKQAQSPFFHNNNEDSLLTILSCRYLQHKVLILLQSVFTHTQTRTEI